MLAVSEPGNAPVDISELAARVQSVSTQLPASLLIRHSIREPIVDPSRTFEASLTDEGRALARRLGGTLPTPMRLVLYHSPVPRCAETARLVAAGFSKAGGTASVAGARDYLACSYIRKDAAVFAHFDEVGHDRFMEEWFGGRLPRSWIENPSAAGEFLLASLLAEEEADRNAVHVHVSHDWNVLLLRGLGEDLRARGVPWPGFLSGVLVRRRGGSTSVDWGEGERGVSGWRRG